MGRLYSDEDLLDKLRNLAEEIGHSPSVTEMDEGGPHASKTYVDRFGSWNEALVEAGLETRKPGMNRDPGPDSIPKEKLLQELNRVSKSIEDTPSIRDMRKQGKYCVNTYQNAFGSWNEALKKAGLEPNVELQVPKERLLEVIHDLAERLGRPPKCQELNKLTKYSRQRYRTRFGSWTKALRAAGYKPYHVRVRSSDGKLPYGSKWPEIREATLKRDDYECQECGKSREQSLTDYGQDLHVHHKTPRREYLDSDEKVLEEGNDFDNLITLCSSCHRTLENPMK